MRRSRSLISTAALSALCAVISGPVAVADQSAVGAGWRVDTGYGANGFVRVDDVFSSDTVVVPGGGAYTIVEDSVGDTPERSLVRFTESGEIDEDFGVGGFARVTVGPLEHLQMELQKTSAGPRLIVSEWATFGTAKFYRFRMNGRPDRTFGNNGVASIPLGREMYIRELAISAQQAIVTTGDCPFALRQSYPCLLVLTPNGAADREFDSDGFKVWKDLGKNISLSSIAVTSDGSRIYVGGQARDPHGWMIGAFRPDGKLDADFGAGGVSRAQPDCLPRDGIIRLHLESSGDLVAVGYACKRIVFARVTSDGELDPEYGDGGWTAIGDGADDMYPYDSVFDSRSDTGYWLYGGEDGHLHVLGVRSDGSLDPAFGPTRELVIEFDPPATGFWDPDLDLDAKGRLYAVAWYPDDVDFRGLVGTRVVNADGSPSRAT